MQRDELASVVVVTMKAVLSPVQERLGALEAALKAWVMQTDALLALTKELGPMRERLATLETRPQLPGPPGQDGAAGQDGAPGAPGSPGLEYRDVYQDSQSYDRGHIVTYAGSAWHCNTHTSRRPGDGTADWTLMVKRGRDAKGAP